MQEGEDLPKEETLQREIFKLLQEKYLFARYYIRNYRNKI